MDRNENTVYVRYSTNDYTQIDENYPQQPNDNRWNLPFSLVEEGATFHHIDAVFNSPDDKVYLFSDNKFIYFDNRQRWWSEPQYLATYWDSIPFQSVDAAFTGKDGKTYLFSGTEYLRYSGDNFNQVEDIYPNITDRYWGNVVNNIAKTGKVDAAVVVISQAESHDYQLEITTSQLPEFRTNTIAIAKIGDNYKIRIFDSNSDIILNQENEEFIPNHILQQKIDSAVTQFPINRQTTSEIIDEITLNLNLELKLIHTYLFSGDQFFRYQGYQYDIEEEGYPKYISTSLHLEPRFQNLEKPWSGKIDAAFADRRQIYLFGGNNIHTVSEKLYQFYSYNELDIKQVKCAFLENSSLYIAEGEGENNSWNRFSNIESREVERNSVEPPILRKIPEKFKTELDAVLHGVDNNTYLFKGADCFNVLLNKEYPLNEEWGRVDNNVYINKSIDAAFVGLDGKTYLFSDHQYITYSGNNYIKQEIETLPQEISENWGGLTTVALAFVKDDKTYLFEKADEQGQQYQNSAEVDVKPIQGKWGKIKNNFTDSSTSINAGFVSERGYIYLFKADQYKGKEGSFQSDDIENLASSNIDIDAFTGELESLKKSIARKRLNTVFAGASKSQATKPPESKPKKRKPSGDSEFLKGFLNKGN